MGCACSEKVNVSFIAKIEKKTIFLLPSQSILEISRYPSLYAEKHLACYEVEKLECKRFGPESP